MPRSSSLRWYSGNPYELFTFLNRAGGPYAWAYWIMISCNVISPQVFWFKKARTSIPILFTLSIVINIGMWFERFVIIVTSLHRDFLPSSWGYFSPTIWDISCLLGSFGLFFTMFCLFVRFLPMVATAEVKTVLPQAHLHGLHDHEHESHHTHPLAPPPGGDRSASKWSFQLPLVPRLPKGPHYGILAEFTTPADLYRACERVRDAGFTKWDAHSPFPVHGLHKAMGLRRSLLPWIVLVMALTGAVAGFVPAVVGPHQRLPPRDQRQAIFHLARLHSDHLRGLGPLRRARRRLWHVRLEPAPNAPPSALPIQGLRARERRRLLHLD